MADDRLNAIRKEMDYMEQHPTRDIAELERRSQRLQELRAELEKLIKEE